MPSNRATLVVIRNPGRIPPSGSGGGADYRRRRGIGICVCGEVPVKGANMNVTDTGKEFR